MNGCRLPKGGGRVMAGAMPFSHRWLGIRCFRKWHGICSPRRFTMLIVAFVDSPVKLDDRLELQCEGMEFATEMIIKASLHGRELPRSPSPSMPMDAGRTHRICGLFVMAGERYNFLSIFSPRWLFLVPGDIFAFLGVAGYAVVMPRLQIGGVTFDAHTLLFSSLAILMGYQSVLFGIFAKTFAINEGLLPKDPYVDRFINVIYLERGLAIGATGALIWFDLVSRCGAAVEIGQSRPSRLHGHDALGHTGRDADRAGLSNRTVKFFREHSGDETSHVSQASTALKSESDAYAAEYDAMLMTGAVTLREAKHLCVVRLSMDQRSIRNPSLRSG